jgi:hypothetical protein
MIEDLNENDWKCSKCGHWSRAFRYQCLGCGWISFRRITRQELRERAAEHKIATILRKHEAPARRLVASERPQERIADSRELSLQTLGAVAVLAGPGLRSVLISAPRSVMRILNLDELEVLFPVGPLFCEGCRAKADLNPAGRAVCAKAGVLHVPQIFAAGDRALAEGSVFNRLEKRLFAAWPDTGAHQVPHAVPILYAADVIEEVDLTRSGVLRLVLAPRLVAFP